MKVPLEHNQISSATSKATSHFLFLFLIFFWGFEGRLVASSGGLGRLSESWNSEKMNMKMNKVMEKLF